MIIEKVRVFNRNPSGTYVDRYDGQEYRFPAGQSVEIPREAAEHIFGFRLSREARRHCFRRSGLALHPEGAKIWANFSMQLVSEATEHGSRSVSRRGSSPPA